MRFVANGDNNFPLGMSFFATSIGHEYAMASAQMGLSSAELLMITRTAIEAAFVDGETRRALLARLSRGE